MLASLPTPYDRSAIAIAAGGDAQVLSPNGTTLVTAGGRDGDGEVRREGTWAGRTVLVYILGSRTSSHCSSHLISFRFARRVPR